MNKIHKVLKYIDNYYRICMERPQMMFGSPESYEAIVVALEMMRDSLTQQAENDRITTYSDYLGEEGFQSANFTGRYMLDHSQDDIDRDKFFEAYTHFLMGYLQGQGRLLN